MEIYPPWRLLRNLEEEDYLKSTDDKYISYFKALIGIAEQEDIHSNHKAKGLFRHAAVEEHEKTTAVYFTKEELEGLYNMELCGSDAEVRDAFIIACYTGQRYSDFIKITPSCFDTIFDDVEVIKKVQTKTKNQVIIPIMDNKPETILKKYNYRVPKMTDQHLNRHIKRICRELSKTVKSLGKDVKTILTKQEREAEEKKTKTFRYDEDGDVIKYKWELVATHIGRRTCTTNMYLSKKYDIREMMLVTGHKKVETFMKYIKLGLEEDAYKLAKSSDGEMF